MAKRRDLGSISGLPPELGIDDDLGRTGAELAVRMDRRRYGKPVTIVAGFDDSVDLRAIARTLKTRLACGGTVEGREVVLQGNHVARIPAVLADLGFSVRE